METTASVPQASHAEMPIGALLCAAMVLLGGVVIGVITFFVSRLIYLPILFPLGMGFAGTLILRIAADKFNVSNRRLRLVLGIVVALSIYGAFRYSEFVYISQELIGRVIQDAAVSGQTISRSQASMLMDIALIKLTGQPGFWGLLALQAKDGIGINLYTMQLGGAPISVTFNGVLAWLYWAAEITIILYMCTRTRPASVAPAKKRVCALCGKRYVRESLGSVPQANADAFTLALGSGDMTRAGQMVVSHDLGRVAYPHLDVEVEHCDNCHQGLAILRVAWERPIDRKRVERQQILQEDIDADDSLALSAATQKPAAA